MRSINCILDSMIITDYSKDRDLLNAINPHEFVIEKLKHEIIKDFKNEVHVPEGNGH